MRFNHRFQWLGPSVRAGCLRPPVRRHSPLQSPLFSANIRSTQPCISTPHKVLSQDQTYKCYLKNLRSSSKSCLLYDLEIWLRFHRVDFWPVSTLRRSCHGSAWLVFEIFAARASRLAIIIAHHLTRQALFHLFKIFVFSRPGSLTTYLENSSFSIIKSALLPVNPV